MAKYVGHNGCSYIKEEKTIHYKDGSVYQGHVVNGRRHGIGKCIYLDKSYYEGEWENDKRTGTGVMKYSESNSKEIDFYYGDWKNDKRDGLGTIAWKNGTMFSGCWLLDKLIGTLPPYHKLRV